MPKTAEVVSATILGVLRGVKELSDALPPPAGPIIKGVVQTTLYIVELAEVSNQRWPFQACSDCGSHQKYEQSKKDVFRLAFRAAEIAAIVVNSCDPRILNVNPELQNNLDRLKRCVHYTSHIRGSHDLASVLEEIHIWIKGQTELPSKRQKVIRFFKSDDTCACLNKKLDNAITHFGVCTFFASSGTPYD